MEDRSHIFSVSELTRSIRSFLESEIGIVWIEGEICNLRKQSSGHQYFTLKDDKCQIPCVLFQRGTYARRQIILSDGMQVQLRGELTVYEARGQYQINVELVQSAGLGALQLRFEALKTKLNAEGLFDSAHKKPLPKFPKRIGIVTSPTGAVIRDMLNILQRRAPWIEILIYPVRVQGKGAATEIALAISNFNRAVEMELPEVDVIVLARGGGSAEDLWEFNEEIVARSIFNSALPVVSAIGHEIDFTISDFVADLRAPTPSAAAEIIAPDQMELLQSLEKTTTHFHRIVRGCLEKWRDQFGFLARGSLFREPERFLIERAQQLDLLDETLQRRAMDFIAEWIRMIASRLSGIQQHRPDFVLRNHQHQLAESSRRLSNAIAKEIIHLKHRMERSADLLRALSPEIILSRGYTITAKEGGEIVCDPRQVPPQTVLITTTKKGKIRSVVS